MLEDPFPSILSAYRKHKSSKLRRQPNVDHQDVVYWELMQKFSHVRGTVWQKSSSDNPGGKNLSFPQVDGQRFDSASDI